MSPDMPGIIQRRSSMRFHLYGNVSALVHLAFRDPEEISWLKLRHPFVEEGTWFSNYSAMGYGGITYLYMPMTVINLSKSIEDHGYEAIPMGR